jgi:hypothetical protein
MRALIIAGFLLLLAQTSSRPTLEVGEDRLLSANGPALPLAESHLSANPNDANQLLAGVIQLESADGNKRSCVAWASFDGGQTWARHAFSVQGCGDPWGVILPDGTAIMVMLGYVPNRDDNLYLFRSPDGGRTWPETPQGLGGHHDHPMIVAQGSQVYVVSAEGIHNSANQHRSTVSVSRSQDGGKTFADPTRVTASNLGYEAEGPVVLSDGTLEVGFDDHHRQGSSKRLMRPRIWLLRSNDQGRTFSEPLLVSESCEGHGGWPSMAADAHDRLFWLCVTDKFNGVLVQRSDDRGESWSEPVRIDHRESADSHTPSIAVNKDGIIGVSWYERHDKNCLDTYFTASFDSGKTFVQEVKVSSTTSCPNTPENKGGFPLFEAGGDYSGLAATADGLFHVVWSDARDGIYKLRTTTVSAKR